MRSSRTGARAPPDWRCGRRTLTPVARSRAPAGSSRSGRLAPRFAGSAMFAKLPLDQAFPVLSVSKTSDAACPEGMNAQHLRAPPAKLLRSVHRGEHPRPAARRDSQPDPGADLATRPDPIFKLLSGVRLDPAARSRCTGLGACYIVALRVMGCGQKTSARRSRVEALPPWAVVAR